MGRLQNINSTFWKWNFFVKGFFLDIFA